MVQVSCRFLFCVDNDAGHRCPRHRHPCTEVVFILSGDGVLLGRLTWQVRLTGRPVLTRGVFAGMTLEAGNAWALPREMRLTQLRWGTSAFLAADTGIGPLYLGLTWAPQGRAGITLRLGRP